MGRRRSPLILLNLGCDTTRNSSHHLVEKRETLVVTAFSYEEGAGALLPGLSFANSVMKTLRISWPLSTIQNNLIIIHVTL